MQDFEKLGQFYLGKQHDIRSGDTTDNLLLYDSKDLTTHAVCVGMTGSGKTGLCLTLLEEAGMDNIPAIVIDPKGDISNLLLTFPDLAPSDFRPWIEESQATRKGMSADEFAKSQADLWKNGLGKWGQDGERIRKFREKVDLTIYTPGSKSGVPLTILKSFDAPAQAIIDDSDAFRERIASASSGLLALLGIDADPIQSREHILISKILENAWKDGRDLNLSNLISEIQVPPFKKVGIMELDKFYSENERMKLSMTLNNLLASPSFSSWMEGETLDIKKLLNAEDGKPRISIVSIAHLSDSERMFFVTILLNEVLSWMRQQSGTSSLRAILYMDEVFGYFPPVGNPPSKTPMLTLLKQARAFGLGCVLATQNPVDLDYKGLSNTGTWFLGRLQTERDKMRVIEGLEGAAASSGATFDRQEMEQILAGLGNRVFLMNNVHDDHPVVFETRWAMSYLRGPMTRNHIQDLMADKVAQYEQSQSPNRPGKEEVDDDEKKKSPENVRPKLPKEATEFFLEPTEKVEDGERLIYRPAIFGSARLHFSKSTYKVDTWETRSFLLPVRREVPDDVWDKTEEVDEDWDLVHEPEDDAEFAKIPEDMEVSKNYTKWKKEFKSYLYRVQGLKIWKCAQHKAYSAANETEGEFRARLEILSREKRDVEVEKLREKYASKLKSICDKIERAQRTVEKEKDQATQKWYDSALTLGTSVLGAVFGRKIGSSTNVTRAGSSMRSFGRVMKERGDVGRAEEKLEDLIEDREKLEEKFNEDEAKIEEKMDASKLELEEIKVTPIKSDISIDDFGVLWLPWRVDESGIAETIY